jgi:hypothetical protein
MIFLFYLDEFQVYLEKVVIENMDATVMADSVCSESLSCITDLVDSNYDRQKGKQCEHFITTHRGLLRQ